MWESPISIYQTAMNGITTEIEGQIIAEIKTQVGIDIDKEELIRAINYDRDSYNRGYNDGLNADRWIPVSERLPKCNGVYEVTMRSEDGLYESACYFDGQDTWHNDNRVNFDRPFVTDKVIAWMPKPEPYKEESEEEDE